jgi:hypothetical protein
MSQLIFDDGILSIGTINKYESRLVSPLNKAFTGKTVLINYYQINTNQSPVDKGLGTIDQDVGKNSPLRFNKIIGLPVSMTSQQEINTDGSTVQGVLDISQNGEIIIHQCTIAPNVGDRFMIQHINTIVVFVVTGLDYNGFSPDQSYKLSYTLEATDSDYYNQLENQVIETYKVKLEDFGTDVNPIIKASDYDHIRNLELVRNDMIEMYIANYYNRRHDTILYAENLNSYKWYMYDECMREFIKRHSLLNVPNSPIVLVLEEKLDDTRFNWFYSKSVWHWLERDAPLKYANYFRYRKFQASSYVDSTFWTWMQDDCQAIWPVDEDCRKGCGQIFSNDMINKMECQKLPETPIEKVIINFTTGRLTGPKCIDLNIFEELMDNYTPLEMFFYVPMVLYIIQKVIKMR